jgi:hypothetical protein
MKICYLSNWLELKQTQGYDQKFPDLKNNNNQDNTPGFL